MCKCCQAQFTARLAPSGLPMVICPDCELIFDAWNKGAIGDWELPEKMATYLAVVCHIPLVERDGARRERCGCCQSVLTGQNPAVAGAASVDHRIWSLCQACADPIDAWIAGVTETYHLSDMITDFLTLQIKVRP
jgi:hypothetical protein